MLGKNKGRRSPRMRYRGAGGKIASIMSVILYKKLGAKSTKFISAFLGNGENGSRCERCGGGEFRLLGSAFIIKKNQRVKFGKLNLFCYRLMQDVQPPLIRAMNKGRRSQMIRTRRQCWVMG